MLKIVRCRKCEALFKQTKINQRYCAKCKAKIVYYVKAASIEKECPQCKKKFITSLSRQVFCSQTCKNIFYGIKQGKQKRLCKYRKCNKSFETTNSCRDYCCFEHYYLEKLAREHEARSKK